MRMGKKRREKLERRERQVNPRREPRRAKSANGFKWLMGALIGVSLLIAGIVVVFQRNPARFMQSAVLASAAVVEGKLQKGFAKLTYEDRTHISRIVQTTRVLAASPVLDNRAAGQLRFILAALEEIIREGNLQPNELSKAEAMAMQVRQYLARRQSERLPAKP